MTGVPNVDVERADLCASGQQVRALMDAAQTILDRGYVSQSIAEEKPDHDALRDALAALAGKGEA